VGDLPDFCNHKPSANRAYAFSTRKPLFPFGFGLSYTAFRFENMRVETSQIVSGGTAKVSVDIANIGSREGDEVPQLYVHQRVASVHSAGHAVERIPAGHAVDRHRVVEPGVFDLMVGPSSDQTSSVALTVVGAHGESGKPLPPPATAGSESD